MCHGLSKTLSKNLSRIGFSQLAHWSIVWSYSKPSERDIQYSYSVSPSNCPSHLGVDFFECSCMIQEIQCIQKIGIFIASSVRLNVTFLFHRTTIHIWPTAPNNKSAVENNWQTAFLKQNYRLENIMGPSKWSKVRDFMGKLRKEKKNNSGYYTNSLLCDISWVVSKVEKK